MTKPTIIVTSSDLPLAPAPIEASWILEGAPHARNRELSHSDDWSAWTMAWDCTAGRFEWHYDIDETVHIVEGSVLITADGAAARRLQAGDVAFFPAGSSAVWHVETYVRKVAFCRKTLPAPLVLLQKIHGRVRKLFRSSEKMGALSPV